MRRIASEATSCVQRWILGLREDMLVVTTNAWIVTASSKLAAQHSTSVPSSTPRTLAARRVETVANKGRIDGGPRHPPRCPLDRPLPPPRGVNHDEATCKVERKQQLSIILRSNPGPIARSPFVQSSQPTLCHVRPSPEPVWPDLPMWIPHIRRSSGTAAEPGSFTLYFLIFQQNPLLTVSSPVNDDAV